ncbi:MAG: ribosome silencing factor [Chlamydiales bacterium]|nr:ribosome silencing factor [Chlamydiales bacterium]
MKKDPLSTLNLVAQTLFDKKGFNIIALDVKGISSITDYILVAEGNVDRHVVALSKSIQQALLEIGEKPIFVEGEQNGDWVVLDYMQLIVHIFMPGLRDKYQLEKLFPQAEIIDLDIVVNNLESSVG